MGRESIHGPTHPRSKVTFSKAQGMETALGNPPISTETFTSVLIRMTRKVDTEGIYGRTDAYTKEILHRMLSNFVFNSGMAKED